MAGCAGSAGKAIRSPRWSMARMAGGDAASALAHAIDMNRLIPAENKGVFKIRLDAMLIDFQKLRRDCDSSLPKQVTLMSSPFPRSALLLAMLACLAASCTRTPEEPGPVSVSELPFAAPAESAGFQPEFPADEPAITDTPVFEPRTSIYPDLRIDASSPDALLRSLQAMERARPADDMEVLKQALAVVQMDAQQRIYRMVSGQPVPPQFSDQQLMEIVYSGIDGMTLEQVVVHAGEIAGIANQR